MKPTPEYFTEDAIRADERARVEAVAERRGYDRAVTEIVEALPKGDPVKWSLRGDDILDLLAGFGSTGEQETGDG